uniref:HDC07104 n=1 Tax=Drosophila melanogaster TaxID=7227 RepID=Q6IG72_DROME|nr:TPA_inf: HDC07104 [Drosophila melanogaster]
MNTPSAWRGDACSRSGFDCDSSRAIKQPAPNNSNYHDATGDCRRGRGAQEQRRQEKGRRRRARQAHTQGGGRSICRVGGATKEQEHWNRTGWGSRGIFGVPQTRQLGCLLSDLVIRDRRPQCIHRLKNFFGACRVAPEIGGLAFKCNCRQACQPELKAQAHSNGMIMNNPLLHRSRSQTTAEIIPNVVAFCRHLSAFAFCLMKFKKSICFDCRCCPASKSNCLPFEVSHKVWHLPPRLPLLLRWLPQDDGVSERSGNMRCEMGPNAAPPPFTDEAISFRRKRLPAQAQFGLSGTQ